MVVDMCAERTRETNIFWSMLKTGIWSGICVEEQQKGCDSAGRKRMWSVYWRDERWHKIRSDSAVLLEDECHSTIQVPGERWVKEMRNEGPTDRTAWNSACDIFIFLESCHDTVISWEMKKKNFFCFLSCHFYQNVQFNSSIKKSSILGLSRYQILTRIR